MGSTAEGFRFKWNNYKSYKKKLRQRRSYTKKERYLHEHFLDKGCSSFIDDVATEFIGKTDPWDSTRREEFWRTKLKALGSFGFSVGEWFLLTSFRKF